MSDNTAIVEKEQTPKSGKVAKAKETISLVSTVLPIVGAVGTLFVWVAANFYIGAVNVQPTNPYRDMTVKVYTDKGQESVYKTPVFSLMPGKYHVTASVDDETPVQQDIQVVYGKTTPIVIANKAAAATDAKDATLEQTADDSTNAKKHWWQFWKKTANKESDSI